MCKLVSGAKKMLKKNITGTGVVKKVNIKPEIENSLQDQKFQILPMSRLCPNFSEKKVQIQCLPLRISSMLCVQSYIRVVVWARLEVLPHCVGMSTS